MGAPFEKGAPIPLRKLLDYFPYHQYRKPYPFGCGFLSDLTIFLCFEPPSQGDGVMVNAGSPAEGAGKKLRRLRWFLPAPL